MGFQYWKRLVDSCSVDWIQRVSFLSRLKYMSDFRSILLASSLMGVVESVVVHTCLCRRLSPLVGDIFLTFEIILIFTEGHFYAGVNLERIILVRTKEIVRSEHTDASHCISAGGSGFPIWWLKK